MPQTLRSQTRKTIEPTQREVLREVMLAAAACGTWLTLDELAKLTHYPQASISAQLRHLRKPWHGAFVVEKKRREMNEVTELVVRGPVWEYQVRRAVHWSCRRTEV